MTKDFHEMLFERRSIRKFTSQDIAPQLVETIVEAGLLAPTSKNGHSWQFTLVDDREMLTQLSMCKPQFATPVKDCKLAIVVSGNPLKSDVWVEDASIAASYMQLQVEALGMGSCWIQVRSRMLDHENTSSEFIKGLLNIDAEQQVLCVLAIGYRGETKRPASRERLLWENVHVGAWKKLS